MPSNIHALRPSQDTPWRDNPEHNLVCAAQSIADTLKHFAEAAADLPDLMVLGANRATCTEILGAALVANAEIHKALLQMIQRMDAPR